MRTVDAGAAAGCFLGAAPVRRAVGPEKELRAAADGGLHQRFAVTLPLQHGQAVEVRTQAAGEHRRAIEQQVLGGERGREVPMIAHERHRFARRRMLEDDPQSGQPFDQRRQHPINETGFAIKGVDGRIGDFAMDEQRQVEFSHALEHRQGVVKIANAGIRIRGCARRVVLDADDGLGGDGPVDFGRRRRAGQVERHQRLEGQACRRRRADPLAVGKGLGGGAHGRLQVRHDDGAAEHGGRVCDDGAECRPVAQVQVPVVRPADGQARSRHPWPTVLRTSAAWSSSSSVAV